MSSRKERKRNLTVLGSRQKKRPKGNCTAMKGEKEKKEGKAAHV